MGDHRRLGSLTHSKTVKDVYRLGDPIGKGAFGKVFRCLNLRTGEVVAIKQIEKNVLQEDTWPIVQKEQEMLQKLEHPNIVKCLDQHETKSHIYLVFELMEGGSLYDVMKRCGNFTEGLLKVYMIQVLCGLGYLHQQHIVHRDLKGVNLLLTKDGVCKLADFGSCTIASVNRRLSMLGTPFWTAPEIIEGTEGGVSSDIWALGCTIIELLTSTPPYWHQGSGVALFKMVEDPHPPFPPSITPEMEEFLLQCFIRDVDKRATVAVLSQHPWILSIANSSSSPETASPPTNTSPTTRRSTSAKSSLFHTLFSKKDKEDPSLCSSTSSTGLDRTKSLSGPLQKRGSGSSIRTSESMEGISDTLNNANPDSSSFQQVVNVWKDKDRLSTSTSKGRPKSVQLFVEINHNNDNNDNDAARRERGQTVAGGGKVDPRVKRRNAIEDSVSDWFGGESKKEERKKKEKKEEKSLVKDMGKKLEQEIAKRQKLTQLLEGHKNTVSLLIEQKNQLEEKFFQYQKLVQEKKLKKLISELLENEIEEMEFRTMIETQLTLPSETVDNNWRLPGTRCLVRAEYDIWQEAVILGSAPSTAIASSSSIAVNNSKNGDASPVLSVSATPTPPPLYRIIVIGRLPAMEETFPASDLKPIESS